MSRLDQELSLLPSVAPPSLERLRAREPRRKPVERRMLLAASVAWLALAGGVLLLVLRSQAGPVEEQVARTGPTAPQKEPPPIQSNAEPTRTEAAPVAEVGAVAPRTTAYHARVVGTLLEPRVGAGFTIELRYRSGEQGSESVHESAVRVDGDGRASIAVPLAALGLEVRALDASGMPGPWVTPPEISGYDPGLPLRLAAPHARDVVGQVVDAEAQPAPHAHVLWTEIPRTGPTQLGAPDDMATNARLCAVDEQGKFRIRTAQPIVVRAFSADRASPLLVCRDESPSPLAMRLQPTRVIAGRVLRPDGSPCPNAEIALVRGARARDDVRERRGARADAHGAFRFAWVEPLETELHTRADGLPQTVRTLNATETGGELPIEIALARPQRIAGHVRDPLGKAVAGAIVRARRASVVVAEARTDELGAFTLDGLAQGEHEIVFSPTGEKLAARRIGSVLATEPSQPLDVVLPAATSLRGTLIDMDGRPRRSQPVLLDPEHLDEPEAVTTARRAFTDADGRFELRGLAKGLYRLRAPGLREGQLVRAHDGAAPLSLSITAIR